MIISTSFLQSYANSNNITLKCQEDILLENRSYFFESGTADNRNYDIFLSHSYFDRVLVLALVNLFNHHHFSVYVDWIEDKQLDRNNVSNDTADHLRNTMKRSKGLAYLTTKNITNSKWCPWELGYFDGLKQSKCCILPIMNYGNIFKGQEYLGLYSYLEYASLTTVDKGCHFYICNQERNKFIKLRDWLDGNYEYYTGILV